MNFPWRTLTVISLAINVLIIGAAIGFFLSHFPRDGGSPFGWRDRQGQEPGQGPGQGQGLRALPDAERTELSRALTGAWESGSDLRKAAQDARRAASEIVVKDPYDEAGARKALADMRAADNAVLAHYQDALAASFGKLSSEQRLMALRAANRPGGGGPGRLFNRDGRRGEGRGRDGDGAPQPERPPQP